jgi:hypothetical protein
LVFYIWVLTSESEAITEPSADQGPQPGGPAGVVDVPDPRVTFAHNYRVDETVMLELTLAPGPTALGSESGQIDFTLSVRLGRPFQ